MRPIKFRALIKYKGLPADWIFYGTKTIPYAFNPSPNEQVEIIIEDLQYTGHKSIDGQEVYQDDILMFPGDSHPYVVIWLDDEGCWGVMHSDTIQMGKIGMVRFMKIVGNVWENQELLTKEAA